MIPYMVHGLLLLPLELYSPAIEAAMPYKIQPTKRIDATRIPRMLREEIAHFVFIGGPVASPRSRMPDVHAHGTLTCIRMCMPIWGGAYAFGEVITHAHVHLPMSPVHARVRSTCARSPT